MQRMRDAYGSANSLELDAPRGANWSMRSFASAWNRGRIASIVFERNARPSNLCSRRWSSPSRLSSVSCHHSRHGLSWMLF